MQKTPEEEKEKLAIVILNVKHGDLLQIDQRREQDFSVEEMEMWEALGLTPQPFISDKVRYYLPNAYFTLESIISEIKEGIRNDEPDFRDVHS